MKAKAFLLTLFLSVAAVSLWAQEKYELASVTILPGSARTIAITTAAEEKIFDIPKNSSYKVELLKQVENLVSQGWEIYNTTVNINGYDVYYLRKKKN